MLDPQVSTEEMKSREVELGSRAGLLLFQLSPKGGATDIVFVTLFCISVGTAIAWCGSRWAMPDGHCLNILLFWRQSTAALVFRVGACLEVSLFSPPLSRSSPSLIVLLVSVDLKQQSLSHKIKTLCYKCIARIAPSSLCDCPQLYTSPTHSEHRFPARSSSYTRQHMHSQVKYFFNKI